RIKQIIFFISEVEVEIGESPREQWNQLRREIQHKATLKKLQERLEPQSFQLIDYSNPTEPVKIKCTICKTEQEISYQRALHSAIRCFVCNPKPTKAPYCRKYANAEERQKDLADKFYMKVNTLSNNTLSVSEYKGSGKKITVVCKKCGNTWDIRADHLIQRCFCPSCKRNYR
ncbi:MAG: hypothetical protein II481_05360, partial [Clostridia bacterium]|nr:hypothetical protein [Clostridia bacterium]